MASPRILNIDDLLNPIAGKDPAGVSLDHDFTLVQELDAARKDYEPHPTGPVPKKPEWDKIIKTTLDQLTGKSKDLRLAIRLTEALTQQHGMAGLRDGLALIRGLIEQCWDRLYPVPDVEDGETMAVRGELLGSSLSDPTAGFTFPLTLRAVPVLTIDGKSRSLYDKRLTDEGRENLDYTREDFARAQLIDENVAEDLEQALTEFQLLNQALEEKLEQDAPHLAKLEEALLECRQLVRHYVREPEPESAAPEADGAAGAATGNAALPSGAPQTREAAYRQLTQIAEVLERLEPHSPIPGLLRRAVELGRMPFRKLIREIVRDNNMLTELSREFGIKEEQEE